MSAKVSALALRPVRILGRMSQGRDRENGQRSDLEPASVAWRAALDADIEERRNDKEFTERLARIIEEDREVLDRLAE